MHSLRVAFTLSNVPANTDRLHRSFLRQCFEVVSHLIKTASQNAMQIWLNYSLYMYLSIARSRNILDDFREAYFWLRQNTPDDATVMSWWDYGYQIAGTHGGLLQ